MSNPSLGMSQERQAEILNEKGLVQKKAPVRKPPPGPEPEYLMIMQRIHHLQNSIIEHIGGGFKLEEKWLWEYNTLIDKIETKYPAFIQDLALSQVPEQQR